MNFVRIPVTKIVRKTETKLIAVKNQFNDNITTTVPTTDNTPENKEPIDCDMVLEMLSTSLVIRLMISP